MKVIFWQNMPSHIQAPAMKELSYQWPDEVLCIWCDTISEARRRLGWEHPDLGYAIERILPTRNTESEAIRLLMENREAIHIFSGLDAYNPIKNAFHKAVEVSIAKLGLMVEPGITIGLRGLVRPIRSRILAKSYVNHVNLVLAMGTGGVKYYQKAGFRSETIFPYMYQGPNGVEPDAPDVHDPVRIIYVGKFIRRKGLDLLLNALANCLQTNWTLTVIGDDENGPRMKSLAKSLGIYEHIHWTGAVPNGQVPELLSRNDLCVVPSRFEGWGVVTNEAMMSGIPVICSDSTTSQDLIHASGAGAVFKSGSVAGLSAALSFYLIDPSRIIHDKIKVNSYSDVLKPIVVGEYLSDVLRYVYLGKGPRPNPPWQIEDRD